MTDLTGNALTTGALGAGVRRDAGARDKAGAQAGPPVPRTGADFRTALAALPRGGIRRGYRPEAVERLVGRVADELDRRAQGEPPLLLARDARPDGIALSMPGYAVGPVRELLAAAAEALQTERDRRYRR